MKTILMTAVAAATLIAAPAFAQTSSTINLNGTVANQCGKDNHSGGYDTHPDYTRGDVNLGIIQLDNGQLLEDTVIAEKRSFGNMWCNFATTVRLEVSQVKTSNTTTDVTSFANSFDVEVEGPVINAYLNGGAIRSNGAVNGFQSRALPGAFETGAGQYSSLSTIKVLRKARPVGTGYLRPVAGTYTGAITLTVGVS